MNLDGEFTNKDVISEAKSIYDMVCDCAMENGRDLPWWSELPEESCEYYINKAKNILERRSKIFKLLKDAKIEDVLEWVDEKQYDLNKDYE